MILGLEIIFLRVKVWAICKENILYLLVFNYFSRPTLWAPFRSITTVLCWYWHNSRVIALERNCSRFRKKFDQLKQGTSCEKNFLYQWLAVVVVEVLLFVLLFVSYLMKYVTRSKHETYHKQQDHLCHLDNCILLGKSSANWYKFRLYIGTGYTPPLKENCITTLVIFKYSQ